MGAGREAWFGGRLLQDGGLEEGVAVFLRGDGQGAFTTCCGAGCGLSGIGLSRVVTVCFWGVDVLAGTCIVMNRLYTGFSSTHDDIYTERLSSLPSTNAQDIAYTSQLPSKGSKKQSAYILLRSAPPSTLLSAMFRSTPKIIVTW